MLMTKQPDFNPQQLLTYFDALQIVQIVENTKNCESVRLRFGGMLICLDRVSHDQGMRAEAPLPAGNLAAAIAAETDIAAPMVGFFHHCSADGETLHVRVGDMVQATDTIGIVKAMGISKPIVAGVSGQVIDISVADAGFVEYGQPMLRIRQAAQ